MFYKVPQPKEQPNHQVTRNTNRDLIAQAQKSNIKANIWLLIINLIAVGVIIYNLMQFHASVTADLGKASRMSTANVMYLANMHVTLLVMIFVNVTLAILVKPQWQAPKTSLILFFQKDLWVFLNVGSQIGLHYAAKAIVKFTQDAASSSWLDSILTTPTFGQLITDLLGLLIGVIYLIGALAGAGTVTRNYNFYNDPELQHYRHLDQMARSINNSL